MPLIYDPEFQKVLDSLVDRARRDGRRSWFVSIVMYAIALIASHQILSRFLEGDSLTGGMIIAAALVIVSAIMQVSILIHVSLVASTAATEWIGRKQLGELQGMKDVR